MMQGTYREATTTGPPMMDQVLAAIPAADNPYQPPQQFMPPGPTADVSTGVLASRGARLAAAIIDYLCALAVSMPGLAGFIYAGSANSGRPAMEIASLAFVLGLGMLGLIQATQIVKDGQSLGKKMMRIKIVDHGDGKVPPWPRVLGIRYVANMALRQVPFYYFIDVFFIFGAEQRCLHDYLANTKVVEA